MIAVPSRRDWHGALNSNGKSILVEHHTVFGWKVYRHVLPPGASLITFSKTEIPAALAPNRVMYVRGLATCSSDDGTVHVDRVPGLYSQERPTHHIGTTTTTAVEETEFWCFNYTANRKSLPALTPVRLAAGESYECAQGALLFVMSGTAGELEGPTCLTADEQTTITADTALYAFLIAEAKQ